jgi:hypothetical protein
MFPQANSTGVLPMFWFRQKLKIAYLIKTKLRADQVSVAKRLLYLGQPFGFEPDNSFKFLLDKPEYQT